MKKYTGGATIFLNFFDAEGKTPEDAVLDALENGQCEILDTVVTVISEEDNNED